MILFLKPYFEPKVWAGTELNKIYDCKHGTGEAWIVSGYAQKSSIINNGPYKGKTLRYLWREHPELFGSIAYEEPEFPVLIKLISSSEDLSIQVHPDDEYALKNENSLGKFECWYVLDGNEAKTVTLGTKVKNKFELESLIKQKLYNEFLYEQAINPGDLVIVNPGTVHALHKNSFVLEIQESSDVTYRLYDYDRIPKRDLHIDKSMDVIKYNDPSNNIFSFKENSTFKNKHFNVYRLEVDGVCEYENKGFEIFYVLDGEGIVDGKKIHQGDTFIFTSEKENVTFSGHLSLIGVLPKIRETRKLMRKTALITGATSQDGLYMIEFLLKKNYEIHLLLESKADYENKYLKKYFENEDLYKKRIFVSIGNLTDSTVISKIIEKIKPDEIYNYASQSHINLSYDIPEYTTNVNALGILRILDAVKQLELNTKIFNLSSCYLFDGKIVPQNEKTPMNPLSPYAVSKLYSYYIVKSYRENYGMYAVNGVFYNQESPYRKNGYVSKKIIEGVKRISKGQDYVLHLGNLNAEREWGFAKDYVYASYLMLEQDNPKDYVVGTGVTYSIKDFAKEAFKLIGVELLFKGEGLDEVGYDAKTGKVYIVVDSKFIRLNEPKTLCSDASLFEHDMNFKIRNDLPVLIKQMYEESE